MIILILFMLMNASISVLIHSLVAYIFFGSMFGGPHSWSYMRKFWFWSYYWIIAANLILEQFHIIVGTASWIMFGIGMGCAFLFIFWNDDWFNRRKQKLRSAALKAKVYLAYGIQARRPLPA